jgi:thioester reductase-like protein
LARDLLLRSQARLLVLARAQSPAEAIERVCANMALYGLWDPAWRSRLVGLPGDLGRPYLGLDRATYERVAADADVIIHNGALSSYALPYDSLKATNVLGTLEVLRVASRARLKPVHFISSLAVFPGEPGDHTYFELELEEPRGVVGGYRQTKWVSDRLVTEAGRRGLPVNVYRPGLISGAQDTGACSPDTFLNAIVKGCVQLGAALEFDVTLEMVPVDFCAAAVVHIALSGASHGRCFHLPAARTLRWAHLVELIRTSGYPLEVQAYGPWHRSLVASIESGRPNELERFLPLFGDDMPSHDLGYANSTPHFDQRNLLAALEGTGITCRELDAEFLALCLDYFVSMGFLPAPAAAPAASPSS